MTTHVTRWGMAAIAAAMVATASGSVSIAGASAAAALRSSTTPSVPEPVLLGPPADGGGFDGWTVGALPTWFSTSLPPAAPKPEKKSVPPPTAPVIAALGASGIPEVALHAYVNAEKALAVHDPTCHLRWSLLAAIGRVESNHGRFGGAELRADGSATKPVRGPALDGRPGFARILDTDHGQYDGDTTYDRAVGPMQFLPSTWPFVAADGNGDGRTDPNNIFDAALGAGRYLCAGGADLSDRAQLTNAVLRYNHSADYVALVLALAASYDSGHTVLPTPDAPRPVAPVTELPPPATVGPPPGIGDVGEQSSPPDSSDPGTTTPTPSGPGTPTQPPGTLPPPTSTPPTSEPPTSEPPTSEPPTSEPPTSEPPATCTPTPPASSSGDPSASGEPSGSTSSPSGTSPATDPATDPASGTDTPTPEDTPTPGDTPTC